MFHIRTHTHSQTTLILTRARFRLVALLLVGYLYVWVCVCDGVPTRCGRRAGLAAEVFRRANIHEHIYIFICVASAVQNSSSGWLLVSQAREGRSDTRVFGAETGVLCGYRINIHTHTHVSRFQHASAHTYAYARVCMCAHSHAPHSPNQTMHVIAARLGAAHVRTYAQSITDASASVETVEIKLHI